MVPAGMDAAELEKAPALNVTPAEITKQSPGGQVAGRWRGNVRRGIVVKTLPGQQLMPPARASSSPCRRPPSAERQGQPIVIGLIDGLRQH